MASGAVNKAADGLSDLVETPGNLAGDALTALGKRMSYGGVLFRWLGAVLAALLGVPTAIVKGAGSAIGGLVSGTIRIVGGLLTLDWRGMLWGLANVAAGIAGGAIAVGGKVLELVQIVIGIGWARPLNQMERDLMKRVFQGSIATYNVRIVEGSCGLYSATPRAFVLGNTIYLKGCSAAADPGTFVHECTHVWQNQHVGAGYTAEALASQHFGVGYKWERPADAGLSWADFGREAQGQSIQDMYHAARELFDRSGLSNGAFVFKSVDRSAVARQAIEAFRSRPWRLSALFA